MKLEGANVLITGGAGGIGRECINLFSASGADVAVVDIDRSALDKLARESPGTRVYECDITQSDHVGEVVETVWTDLGRIDVLVNNAAMIANSMLVSTGPGGVVRHSVELWDKIISAGLSSVFYVTSQLAERMVRTRTKGVVVNISSVCAQGNAGQSAYSAAKAGVNALTVAWAKELGPMGIRVVAVSPGFTETQRTLDEVGEAALKEWKGKTSIRRLGKPKQIAEAIQFAIENDFMNASVLEVNGGLRM